MRFQWYIINVDDSTIKGSNDIEEFQHLVDDESYLILSAQHGKFFNGSNDEIEVEPFVDEDVDADADDLDEEDDGDVSDDGAGVDDEEEDASPTEEQWPADPNEVGGPVEVKPPVDKLEDWP